MTHGDDRGLRLPPAVAPVQVAIVPIYSDDNERNDVMAVATKVRDACAGNGTRVRLDDRDQYRPGFKFSEWELKGVPVRIEIGPKDVAGDRVVMVKRTSTAKQERATHDAINSLPAVLDEVQTELFDEAVSFRDENTHEATTHEALRAGLLEQGGFWIAAWCGERPCEERVTEETRATIRVLPVRHEDPGAPCVVCGSGGTERATWARSY